MNAYDRFLQSNYRIYVPGAPQPLAQDEAWVRLHRFENSIFPHPVIFIRGLPGVGKTTFAKQVWPRRRRFEADDFATDPEGQPVSFRMRHEYCKGAIDMALNENPFAWPILVVNTFTQQWEIDDYRIVTDHEVDVPLIIHLHHGTLGPWRLSRRCRHAVPWLTIANMRDRWDEWPGELIVRQV